MGNDSSSTLDFIKNPNCKHDIKTLDEVASKDKDLDRRGEDGLTALHICVKKRNSEFIKVLVSRRASKQIYDNDGLSPITYAIKDNKKKFVDALVDNSSVIDKRNDYKSALLDSLKLGKKKLALHCIYRGSDINLKDSNGWTVLMFSSSNSSNSNDIVRFILKKKGNIDSKNEKGDNAFILACFYGQIKAAKYLLKNNSKLESKNNYGNTALICATNNGKLDIVKFLLKIKANHNAKNKDGNTAMLLASHSKNNEIVKEFKKIQN